MSESLSRRKFLKVSSAAVGAAAVSVSPISATVSPKTSRASKVVICTDELAYANGTLNKEIIQSMVDSVIMELTGVSKLPDAYEALFPGLSSTSKIAIKRNSVSAGGSNRTWQTVYDAFENGLTSMLGGNYEKSNITMTVAGNASNSNPSFTVGSRTYRINDPFNEADYIVNFPVCWAHGTGHGVTMGLKNMMSAVNGGSNLSGLHNYATSSSEPWMSILNSQPTFKDKQVLVIMDCLSARSNGGPGGTANLRPCKILASRDIVAADYQGMLILKDNGLSSSRVTNAEKVFELAAQSPYNLGTDDPTEMEVVEIGISDINTEFNALQANTTITVRQNVAKNEVQFIFDHSNEPVSLSIFNTAGKDIWSVTMNTTRNIVWNRTDYSGRRVVRGNYVYVLRYGNHLAKGKCNISK